MGFLPELLRIAAINENRPASGGMAAINVPPAVAHHPALRQVNAQGLRRPQQHAGFGLAAVAVGCALARMIANFHAVNGQLLAHAGVDGFDYFPLECVATNVGLVGHHHEQKTGLFQLCTGGGNLGENFKFVQVPGRIRFAVTLQCAVDDAIAVKKNSAS